MKELPDKPPMYDLVQFLELGGEAVSSSQSVQYGFYNATDISDAETIHNVISKKGLEIISGLQIPPGILRIHHSTYSSLNNSRVMLASLTQTLGFGSLLAKSKIFGPNAVQMNLIDRTQLNYLILTQKPRFFDDELFLNVASVMDTPNEMYLLFTPSDNQGPNMGLAQIQRQNPLTVLYQPFVLDNSM